MPKGSGMVKIALEFPTSVLKITISLFLISYLSKLWLLDYCDFDFMPLADQFGKQ